MCNNLQYLAPTNSPDYAKLGQSLGLSNSQRMNNGASKTTKIVACVCTRGRPLMLANCVYWMRNQYIPTNCLLEIVVVDNNPEKDEWIQALAIDPMIYTVHEPRAGLSQARNAALAKAYTLQADWIAFIDDDEVPDTDWIKSLYDAAITHCADVVHGRMQWTYPVDAGRWRCINPWGQVGQQEGQRIEHASTANVMFRGAIPRERGLWFDEALGFQGGEDTAFFRQMWQAGAKMVYSCKPVVTEIVPWSRITLAGHWRKSFRNGVFKVDGGHPKAARRVVSGVLRIVGGLLTLRRRAALKGWRKLAEGCGMIYSASGRKYEYYKEVTGQ